MKKDLALASGAQMNSASLRDSIIQLLTAKLSDESRISRILDKLSIRYSHLAPHDYEKALEPLLCLDPVWLYKLMRDCNDHIDGLSEESGLCQFKNTLHSLLTQAIAAEVCPEILESSEANEYNSLAFGKLAGIKRKLSLDEDLTALLENILLSCEISAETTSKKTNSLPTHLTRMIDSSKAYLISALAKARSNSEFRLKVGMDVIKAGYTTRKLSRDFPNLQAIDAVQSTKLIASRSRIIGRIFDESIARFLRDSRMNEGSLHELSEYVFQLTGLQDAKFQAASLMKSIASLRSDLAIAESEKNNIKEDIMHLKVQHSSELDALTSQLLSNKRGNAVENAELGQKLRSILIESRRRIDSERKKLELLLQGSTGDTASSKQRLLDRIRNAIVELDSKILEVIS